MVSSKQQFRPLWAATAAVMMFRLVIGGDNTVIAQGSKESGTLSAQVAELAHPYVESKVVVGLSLGIIKEGFSATIHLGETRIGGETPSDQTVYEIGSISKVFTGILLADAVQRGLVRLDQPVGELASAGVSFPAWPERPITLLDLATHRSGLPRLAANMPSLHSDDPYHDYTSALAYQFLSGHQLRRAPGAESEYSNLGFSLLGHLLGLKQGLDYETLLRDRITRPLAMNDTHIVLRDDIRNRYATPYSSVAVEASPWTFADMPGAGGIRSTMSDMLSFARAQIDPPDNTTGQAIQLAWQKHVDGNPVMGLGWHFSQDGLSHWHNGQTGGFHSMVIINRKLRIAVVLLTNTAAMKVDQLARDIILMLAGSAVTPRQFETPIDVDEAVLDSYVGRYQLAPAFILTVSKENGKLMVGATDQPTLQVFPRSTTEWYYRAVDATLIFQAGENGTAESLELLQNGQRHTAKRIDP
tara:strand:+ start:243921 stop:245333 length:1413 start_codon:yes stop_codon:yes gene_type:complete